MSKLIEKKFLLPALPFFLAFIIILFTVFLLKSLPLKLPLFYSLPWGEKQLASHQQLFIIPATIVLVSLLNLIISLQLHPQQSFFKKILILASILVSLILAITFFKIIFVFI